MAEGIGTGYLARVEANSIAIRSAPNAVFLRLTRSFAAEGQTTSMFTEMTPGQALRLIDELRASVQKALVPRECHLQTTAQPAWHQEARNSAK